MLKNAIYSALFKRTKKIYNTIIRYFTKKKSQSSEYCANLDALYVFYVKKNQIRENIKGKKIIFMGKIDKQKKKICLTIFFFNKNVFVNLVKEL